MKKYMMVAVAMVLTAGAVHAEGSMGGLGFRSLFGGGSPSIGIRQWLTERAGFDAAVGFVTGSQESGTPLITTEEVTGFSFDVGVPISAKKWDKVNVLVRPGFTYGTTKFKDKTSPTPPNEIKFTNIAVSGEIEVEWMVADMLSISASHGVGYFSSKGEDNDSPVNEFKSTSFSNIGNNFTWLGFHVYLW